MDVMVAKMGAMVDTTRQMIAITNHLADITDRLSVGTQILNQQSAKSHERPGRVGAPDVLRPP